MSRPSEEFGGESRGPVFLRALRAAVSRPPLWIITWATFLVLGLVLVGPWSSWFSSTIAHAYAPGSLTSSLDAPFRQDHAGDLDVLRQRGGVAAAVLSLLAVVIGAFFAGGWLQVFLERTSGNSVRRFLWGGARYFWRFARVGVLGVLTLSVFAWILHGWPWRTLLELLLGAPTMEDLEVVTSEWTAVWAHWIQAGLFACAFALTLVWGDYTRTRLAQHDGRSGLWAGLCSWFLILAHPIRTLRPMALILGIEVLVVTLIGKWAWGINSTLAPDSGPGSLVLLLVLGQVALLWQSVSRGARYAAAVQVSQALVPPLAQPDPWASRIGGPGGPQYPIDDTDDYGVSI